VQSLNLTSGLDWGTVLQAMPRLITTNKRSIRKRTYDHLRDQLLNGEIPPYQHLIETKFAKEAESLQGRPSGRLFIVLSWKGLAPHAVDELKTST